MPMPMLLERRNAIYGGPEFPRLLGSLGRPALPGSLQKIRLRRRFLRPPLCTIPGTPMALRFQSPLRRRMQGWRNSGYRHRTHGVPRQGTGRAGLRRRLHSRERRQHSPRLLLQARRSRALPRRILLRQPLLAERDALPDPNQIEVRIQINGELRCTASTRDLVRPIERLLVDITEFLTLRREDILLAGEPHDAPLARAGDRVQVDVDGLASLRSVRLPRNEARPRGLRRGNSRRYRRSGRLRLPCGRIVAEDAVVWLPPVEAGTSNAIRNCSKKKKKKKNPPPPPPPKQGSASEKKKRWIPRGP